MGIGGRDDEDWLRGSPSRTIAAAEDGGPRKRYYVVSATFRV